MGHQVVELVAAVVSIPTAVAGVWSCGAGLFGVGALMCSTALPDSSRSAALKSKPSKWVACPADIYLTQEHATLRKALRAL